MKFKFKLFLIFVFVFIFLCVNVLSIDVDSCREIYESGYYVLTNDVYSNYTCMVISDTSDVTLDCNGYSINWGLSGSSGDGIYIIRANNVTIKNCNFVKTHVTDVNLIAINIFVYSSNIKIINNTFNITAAYAIASGGTINTNIHITNNTFNFVGKEQFSTAIFYLNDVENVNINKSYIRSYYQPGHGSFGMIFGSKIVIDNMYFLGGNIYENLRISGNNITIKNSNFSLNGFNGFCIFSQAGLNNSLIENITCLSTGYRSRGIELWYSANVTITNSKINTTGTIEIPNALLTIYTTNLTAINTSFFSLNLDDVKIQNSNYNYTFIDSYFYDYSLSGNSGIKVYWSIDVKTTFLEGDPLQNATIRAYNNQNQLIFENITKQDGFINRQIVLEKIIFSNGGNVYIINYNPTTINATYQNYNLSITENITSPRIKELNNYFIFQFPISLPCSVNISIYPLSGSIFENFNINFICNFTNVGSDSESCNFDIVGIIVNDSLQNVIFNYFEDVNITNYTFTKSHAFNYSDNYIVLCYAKNFRNETFSNLSFLKIFINYENIFNIKMIYAMLLFIVLFISFIFFYLSVHYEEKTPIAIGFLFLGFIFIIADLIGAILILKEVSTLSEEMSTFLSILIYTIGIIFIFLFFTILIYGIIRAINLTKKRKIRKWGLLIDEEL